MSIAARIWRLVKMEVNSRFGRFEKGNFHRSDDGSSPKPHQKVSTEEAKRASYYRILELPNGAPLYNVKASYKRLMKKYHPDKFQNVEQKAAATKLVKKLNEAHTELSKYLEGS
jgi:DnaJ-domain-containing protein 1